MLWVSMHTRTPCWRWTLANIILANSARDQTLKSGLVWLRHLLSVFLSLYWLLPQNPFSSFFLKCLECLWSLPLTDDEKLKSAAICRDRCLHRWLPLMANTTVTAQMYEENSFMRNSSLTNFIVHILDSLTEFDITLESSLLCGLDI